ncbi:MAG: uroporphyrinogen-III synthase [Candidatus Sericytochromatia bacterium]|nr:uroporphyrinogen-III synthase [Candidatus Tanganyikabacteria bacterium]
MSDLPLAGRTVLVTRSPEQSGDLLGLLAAAGADTLALPTIAFFPPVDPRPLEQAIAEVGQYAWVAFTSSNAVHAFAERLPEPAPALAGVRLAAVGPKTAEALAQWGLEANLIAAKGNAASLADGLGRVCRRGERVLYPRAERVSDDLAGKLETFGVVVDDPIAYRTVPPSGDSFQVAARLKARQIAWITVLSGSALRHLQAMLPEPEHLRTARLASIGPKTSAEAVALGYRVHAEAAEPSVAALVAAIVSAEARA